MRIPILFASIGLVLFAATAPAQKLSTRWEDLTAEDFVKGLKQAQNVCLLPFGIIEKHGPSGPLGTDLINVRAATLQAVDQEYAIVFPEYYFGQIAEARYQPGTLAYKADLQLTLLQATVEEMARNGCSKIVIANGHGGNNALLSYFLNLQLDTEHHYVVYVQSSLGSRPNPRTPPAAAPSGPGVDGHAGEGEISGIMANAPADAHPERAPEESGADRERLHLPEGLATPIEWYSRFPNHYQGDALHATAARGAAMRDFRASDIAAAICFVKADKVSPALQDEFFKKSAIPIQTVP